MCCREQLPENCPPTEATEITTAQWFYRLVETDPPAEGDFASWRARNPTKSRPPGRTECEVRGLSIYRHRSDVERQLKIPKFQGHRIGTVRLEAGAGRIQRTGRGSHHTWWPLAAFDILDHCAVEGPEA